MLPAVVSQLVVIVKDTALGGILVGYVELRRAANTAASATATSCRRTSLSR